MSETTTRDREETRQESGSDEPREVEIDIDPLLGGEDETGAETREAAPGEADEETGETGAEAAADDTVESLRRELAEAKERQLRTLAEFENYRRRTERERRETTRYAATGVLRDLLDVVDNLERAVEAGGSVEDLKVGVEMTLRQTRDVLAQHGVRAVPAVGQEFDPNVHEAVAREEDPEIESPVVLDELQRGYLFHDRLLRPARVRVAVPAEESGSD